MWLTFAIRSLQEVRQSWGKVGGDEKLFDIKRLAVWTLVVVALWVGILKVGGLHPPIPPQSHHGPV